MKNKCKKCAHNWVSKLPQSKQCPACKSTRWFRDVRPRGPASEFGVLDIKLGQKKLFTWSNDPEKNYRLNKRIYKEQAKKKGLRAWATHEGIWVEWVKYSVLFEKTLKKNWK